MNHYYDAIAYDKAKDLNKLGEVGRAWCEETPIHDKLFNVPTGALITIPTPKGEIETLSIADYGKSENVVADFLGLSREIDSVPNQACRPLQEKWVMTLSTQHGCKMGCTFCDVPNVKWGGNVSTEMLIRQLVAARKIYPSVKYVERLNIHFARMGDPIFNDNVFALAEMLYIEKRFFQLWLNLQMETVHPVMTTALPCYGHEEKAAGALFKQITNWIHIKNRLYRGQAGLQFSINSTNEQQREVMFGGTSLSLKRLAKLAESFEMPVGRKYCLNFAYADGFEIDPKVLSSLFDKSKFMIKITPIHRSNASVANGIETVDGYKSFAPYRKVYYPLLEEGWDTLVFIPSMDEEKGLVTCGNAVTGGGQVTAKPITWIDGINASN